MLPLPHDGVCTDCKLEGCSHVISRTPECLHCACFPLKRIYVFFSKEQRRASPRPAVPFLLFFSFSLWRVIWIAMRELFRRIQCKPLFPCWLSAWYVFWMATMTVPCPIACVPHYTCTTVPILCGLHFGLERPSKCSTTQRLKSRLGDQNTTKRQWTIGTLWN